MIAWHVFRVRLGCGNRSVAVRHHDRGVQPGSRRYRRVCVCRERDC